MGYDLQLWVPDVRPAVHGFTTPYNENDNGWLQGVIEPWRNLALNGIDLFVATENVESAETAILYGRTPGRTDRYMLFKKYNF